MHIHMHTYTYIYIHIHTYTYIYKELFQVASSAALEDSTSAMAPWSHGRHPQAAAFLGWI